MTTARSALLLPARGRGGTTALPPAARHWLAWPRLPAVLEVLTLGAGYAAPSLVRLALPADSRAAFAHAAEIYRAEQHVHLNVEPFLNHLVSADAVLALATGYYYGLLHFIVTPLVLIWLYQRRPADFPRLRSALVLASVGANIVFWTWPVAPPRFAVPGMVDVLVNRDILGSADPHGVTSAVNLYAAMPSLHVCWAAWCAVAVVSTTRSRWRHLAWLYPVATAFVVLASANHFVLDVIGGLLVAAFGMAVTGRRPARRRRPGSGGGIAASPAPPRNYLEPASTARAAPGGHTGADQAISRRGRVVSQINALTNSRAAIDAYDLSAEMAGVAGTTAEAGPRRRIREQLWRTDIAPLAASCRAHRDRD